VVYCGALKIPREEVERRKRFLEDTWRFKASDAPPIYMSVDASLASTLSTDSSVGNHCATWSSLGYTKRELMLDDEKMLRQQIYDLNESLKVSSEVVPGVQPYVGMGVYASAFGCKVVFSEDSDPWTVPVVKHPEQVYELQPDLNGGLLPMVLRRIRYFQKETSGDVPIMFTDTQGPLDTSLLIWGYEGFVKAMHTSKKEAHVLLGKVTETIIEFSKIQRSEIKNFFSPGHLGIWAPMDSGISVGDDLAAVLSPRLYAEFAVPYLTRISEAFKGLYIHSCGEYNHNLENMLKIPMLRCVDLHSLPEMDLAKARRRCRGKAVMTINPGLNWEKRFPTWKELWDHIVSATWDGGYGVIYSDVANNVGEGLEKVTYIRSACKYTG